MGGRGENPNLKRCSCKHARDSSLKTGRSWPSRHIWYLLHPFISLLKLEAVLMFDFSLIGICTKAHTSLCKLIAIIRHVKWCFKFISLAFTKRFPHHELSFSGGAGSTLKNQCLFLNNGNICFWKWCYFIRSTF